MSVPSPSVQIAGQGAVSADQLNTYTPSLQTVAQLRAFSGVSGMAIMLQGNLSPNDGGGGYFIWLLGTATDDGGISTVVPSGQTAGYWERCTLGIVGKGVSANAGIEFRYDNGGAVCPTGIVGDQFIPFPVTITQWTIQADQSGLLALDIWADPYTNFTPPTSANSIVGSSPPGFLAANSFQGNPTGWTTFLGAGTWIRHSITAVTNITRYTLTLSIIKNPT